MNKANQKALDRAASQGHDSLMLTIAIIHRAANKQTRNDLNLLIEKHNAWDQFIIKGVNLVNGQVTSCTLLHKSEV